MERALQHLENEQWTEARRAFQSELMIHPKNLEARYNLALLLKRADHHNQERELYQKNMTYGWHLPTIVNLTTIYRAKGETSQAHTLLKNAVKHFKNEATPAYLLADMEEKAGHIDNADSWYQHALRADPLNGFAHIRYAHFLDGRNKHGLALKHADRAIGLEPKCATCLNILGDIQAHSKKQNLALESYQKSLAIKPNSETRQRLIDLLHQLGKHERATRMQQALDAWLKHH
ncbi:MAG: tetratricopeptide repeat protein [Mariprofundaceae bacterium]